MDSIFLILYLFQTVLHFVAVGAFSSCRKQGLPSAEVHWLLIAVTSLVANPGL